MFDWEIPPIVLDFHVSEPGAILGHFYSITFLELYDKINILIN